MEEQSNLKLGQLENRLRNDISLLEDKHRNEVLELERNRNELRAELSDLRNICDVERNRLDEATDNIRSVEGDKRAIQDALI